MPDARHDHELPTVAATRPAPEGDGGVALLHRFKPSAASSTHLLMAALMWTVVGSALTAAGGSWVWLSGSPALRASIPLAVALGVIKSRLVLDRVARKTAERIVTRGDGRCIGGFLSVRSWLLVGVMAGGGRWLRSGHVARPLVGLLYVAVGAALLLSCRCLWAAWSARRRTAPDDPTRSRLS